MSTTSAEAQHKPPTASYRQKPIPRTLWDGWLKVAQILGAIQMAIILTIVYWVFMTVLFIPFGLIADPLRLRKRNSGWIARPPVPDEQTFLRSQG